MPQATVRVRLELQQTVTEGATFTGEVSREAWEAHQAGDDNALLDEVLGTLNWEYASHHEDAEVCGAELAPKS